MQAVGGVRVRDSGESSRDKDVSVTLKIKSNIYIYTLCVCAGGGVKVRDSGDALKDDSVVLQIKPTKNLTKSVCVSRMCLQPFELNPKKIPKNLFV